MRAVQGDPNWNLVTDTYIEPNNFAELFSLLVPCHPKGEGKERTILVWKEKEFYKEENLAAFIAYGMNRVKNLPQFHKDEIPTLVRILRLCQEIGWYEEANAFMMTQGLDEFVQTSLEYETWDLLTKAVALNYLMIKYRIGELTAQDVEIWDRVKFNEKCITDCKHLLFIKKYWNLHFFICVSERKLLSKEQLNSDMMSLAMYCNTFVYDLYTHDLLRKYRSVADFLSYYGPSQAVLACQRAVLSQISDPLDPLKTTHVDDYLYVMKETEWSNDDRGNGSDGHFIGKLLSQYHFSKLSKFHSMHIIVNNYCIFVRELNTKKKYYAIIYLYNYMIVYHHSLNYFLKISVMQRFMIFFSIGATMNKE